jgi:hypothetical protein
LLPASVVDLELLSLLVGALIAGNRFPVDLEAPAVAAESLLNLALAGRDRAVADLLARGIDPEDLKGKRKGKRDSLPVS